MADSVWLLIHDDRRYNVGDTYVRGAYASEKAAQQALVTRTPAGRRSTALDAHNENCCEITEWEIEK